MSVSAPIVASFEGLISRAGDAPAEVIGPLGELLQSLPSECAAISWEGQCLFVANSREDLTVAIDGMDPVPMRRIGGSPFVVHLCPLVAGRVHSYQLQRRIDSVLLDAAYVPGFTELSEPKPEVPVGHLSERLTIRSRIYGEAESDCWFYVNPGIDTVDGAPTMVWLDGERLVGASDALFTRMQIVTDNLVSRRLIPPMVHILLAAAVGGNRTLPTLRYEAPQGSIRQLQYDEMSNDFVLHLLDEVLPQVGAQIRLRTDGYSRAIAGWSSGGACAFKVGWLAAHEFSRIHSAIGSFTAIGWDPQAEIRGAHELPFLVRREPRRNLRVWVSDGSHDLDESPESDQGVAGRAGSWPIGNLQMAQALKLAGYDFHFRYGECGHDLAQVGLDLPESLTWLWRDYDPRRSHQVYEQEPAEKAKPAYRVGVINRDAW